MYNESLELVHKSQSLFLLDIYSFDTSNIKNRGSDKMKSQSLFLLDIYSFIFDLDYQNLNQILKEVSILIFTGYLFFLNEKAKKLGLSFSAYSLNPYFYWISILSKHCKPSERTQK
ncbi:MAG: hypothetical protein JG768_1410 [Fusobacteriales bacterium]|nr:hypothetical protein [Fusobacteriales bacterium]